ncbi:MAG TPA: hypothetical protein VK141_10630 [Nitrosomonas sp.]|nr:hypothetical protein [Nitrosomonas sp.]
MPTYKIHRYFDSHENKKTAWTSVHDIGSSIDEEAFRKEYTNIERAYIALIYMVFILSGDDYFCINEFEGDAVDIKSAITFSNKYGLDMVADISVSEIDHDIKICMLANILRLILREHVWGRVCSQSGIVFDFGYDYYLYITGFQHPGLVDIAGMLGLEVVSIEKSPYSRSIGD